MHRPAECADYACSDARLKAKRISDRDHQLADPQIFGVGETHMGQLRRVDSNHREIGVRIVARQLRRIFASIRQIYSNRIRRVHDVTISQDESVRRDNEPRAVAAELARSAREAHTLFYIDVHNGGGDPRDGTDHGARIRIEQDGIVLTRCRLDVRIRQRWSIRLRLV